MKVDLVQMVVALAVTVGSIAVMEQGGRVPGPKRARTPDDYLPRTLKEIIATGSNVKAVPREGRDFEPSGEILPSRVTVVYQGKSKPLSKRKKAIVDSWARRFAGSIEHYTKAYEIEALFTENRDRHWLAVSKKLVPRLEQELKKGDLVELFVIRMGGVRSNGAWEGVILIEDMRKAK